MLIQKTQKGLTWTSAVVKISLSVVLAVLCFLPLPGQSGLKIESFTHQDGLSFRYVTDILQDREGFLWVSTFDGLNRYDGYEFQVYRYSNQDTTSLANSQVYAIQESEDRRIWIKEAELNLDVLDPVDGRFQRLNTDGAIFRPHHGKAQQTIKLQFLFNLPEVQQWLKTLDPTSPNPLLSQLRNSDLLSGITRSADGEVWVWRYDHRYLRFNPHTGAWEDHPVFAADERVAGHPSLPIDRAGQFWYPSFSGKEDTLLQNFQLPATIPLADWDIYQLDNHQNIWLSTYGGDMYRYEQSSRSLDYFGKIGDRITSIFEDAEGIVWLGSHAGLLKAKKTKTLFKNYLHHSIDPRDIPRIGVSLRTILEGENGLIYTHEAVKSEFYEIDPVRGTSRKLSFIAKGKPLAIPRSKENGPGISDMLPGPDNTAWLATSWGLLQYDLDQETYEAFNPQASPLEIKNLIDYSKDSLLLLDSDSRLYFFAKSSQQFSELPFAIPKIITPVFQKEQNLIWANHKKGLCKINISTGAVDYIPLFPEEKPNIGYARSLLIDGELIWLGTYGGLQLFDPASHTIVKTYTTEHRLPHNIIYSILPSEDYLWLGTHYGLCRFDPDTEAVKNYFVEDGLSHNEFNSGSYLIASDGTFWMGGLNGVNAFQPKDLEIADDDLGNLVWTKLSKYNTVRDSLYVYQRHELRDVRSIEIAPNELTFTLQFALLNFSDPEKNQFSYYLQGYEPPWNHFSSLPVAVYQNIPPGQYTFHLKATDLAGNIANNELQIDIAVLQVWYLRWWAWLLYAALLFFGITYFYRFQLYRNLEKREAVRLKELDLVKTKLYANITHEFRTPLTVILGMADQTRKYYQKNKPDQLYHALEMIKRNGHKLLHLVNQMLDLSKLEAGHMSLQITQGDLIHYIKYIFETFSSYAEAKDIELRFTTEINQLITEYDEEKIMNVLSNLLSNAIKFTPQSGHIQLHVTWSDPWAEAGKHRFPAPQKGLLISVRDSGIGIPAAKLPYVFDRFYRVEEETSAGPVAGTGIGLSLTRELVHLMQGQIRVVSQSGQGSVFHIWLPVRKNIPVVAAAPPVYPEITYPPVTGESGSLVVSQPDEQAEDRPFLLIIEDNEELVQYLRYCLEEEYRMDIASDGQAGIDRAIEQIPDIIISDVMMPKKNGFEVCQTLKQDERTSHIPIILLTGKVAMEDKLAGLETGADAYLTKPFNKAELLLRLRKLLELRERLRQRYSSLDLTNPTEEPTLKIQDAFLVKLKTIILENISDEDFGIEQLCQSLFISRVQLHRKLKALTGKSTSHVIRSIRLQKAKELLQHTDLNVSEIAFEVGFKSLTYLSSSFSEEFGVSPTSFRK